MSNLFQEVFHGELLQEPPVVLLLLLLLRPLLRLTELGNASGRVRQLQLRDQVVLGAREAGAGEAEVAESHWKIKRTRVESEQRLKHNAQSRGRGFE